MARLSVCTAHDSECLSHPFLFRHDFEPTRAENEHAPGQRFRPVTRERGVAGPPERIGTIHAPAVDHRTATMAMDEFGAAVVDCDCQDGAFGAFDHATGILDTSGSPTPAEKLV